MKAELIDHIYLAGLIDADGCVSLNKVDEGRYAPCLSFVNTSKELIDLFEKHFGGHTAIKKHKEPQKPTYEISVRKASEVVFALNQIIPWLRYKKKKALIVRDYAYSIMKNENRKLGPDVKATRKVLRKMWEDIRAS